MSLMILLAVVLGLFVLGGVAVFSFVVGYAIREKVGCVPLRNIHDKTDVEWIDPYTIMEGTSVNSVKVRKKTGPMKLFSKVVEIERPFELKDDKERVIEFYRPAGAFMKRVLGYYDNLLLKLAEQSIKINVLTSELAIATYRNDEEKRTLAEDFVKTSNSLHMYNFGKNKGGNYGKNNY